MVQLVYFCFAIFAVFWRLGRIIRLQSVGLQDCVVCVCVWVCVVKANLIVLLFHDGMSVCRLDHVCCVHMQSVFTCHHFLTAVAQFRACLIACGCICANHKVLTPMYAGVAVCRMRRNVRVADHGRYIHLLDLRQW